MLLKKIITILALYLFSGGGHALEIYIEVVSVEQELIYLDLNMRNNSESPFYIHGSNIC